MISIQFLTLLTCPPGVFNMLQDISWGKWAISPLEGDFCWSLQSTTYSLREGRSDSLYVPSRRLDEQILIICWVGLYSKFACTVKNCVWLIMRSRHQLGGEVVLFFSCWEEGRGHAASHYQPIKFSIYRLILSITVDIAESHRKWIHYQAYTCIRLCNQIYIA